MQVSGEFRQFEENKPQNVCSWAKLNIRRRDSELELTTAHHLDGLLPPGVGCQDFIVLIAALLIDNVFPSVTRTSAIWLILAHSPPGPTRSTTNSPYQHTSTPAHIA